MRNSMMKENERHILSLLPTLLQKDDEFRRSVSVILSEVFATKGELRQILEEISKSREESNKRFEEMDRRFEQRQIEIDKRFEEMDRRFEQRQIEIDKRFDAMDKRFDAMDKRFDAMDKRFDAMDKRFDVMDKRFDVMDKRFDVMDKQFEDQKDWVSTVIGGLQGRAGRNLEDTIAGTLRVALKRKDIKPESIKLRQKIQDDDGIIGPKGRDYEFDILMHNGETAIFEIKSYAETEDVLRFNDKVELAKQKLGLINPSKIFITLQKHKDMMNTCKETGVELV